MSLEQRFLEWQLYNQQVDLLFVAMIIAVVIILAVGWAVFKSSLRMFKWMLKGGLSLFAITLVVLWLWDLLGLQL